MIIIITITVEVEEIKMYQIEKGIESTSVNKLFEVRYFYDLECSLRTSRNKFSHVCTYTQ